MLPHEIDLIPPEAYMIFGLAGFAFLALHVLRMDKRGEKPGVLKQFAAGVLLFVFAASFLLGGAML